MNDDRKPLAQRYDYRTDNLLAEPPSLSNPPAIPAYLSETYSWAYLNENSFWFFEREWVVNLILWGNMKHLTGQVLEETRLKPRSHVLQVACVYGDFSNRLADRLEQSGSKLDLVDVAEIQLKNARSKLAHHRNITYQHQDSSDLRYPDSHFDQTVVFFLLHEQPADVRRDTICEAIRVTRPGGKVVFIDYHGPKKSNPLRYFMKPLLHVLEPFALDLWRNELVDFLPDGFDAGKAQSEFYFGGLYQKMVITV